ncbi:hypothetical protein [Brachybacterium massiliense]|uniref:hypothetical protein n=1 Tax=Brachybacterium massiliense TaxID=1755098 RepID=UPI0011210023|nr:hypothetical protein [Brachybacterium massiliense]
MPVLGVESDLLDLVRAQRPGIVLFAAGCSASAEEFRRVAWELEGLDVGVIVVPRGREISGDRIRMRPGAGLPLVHADHGEACRIKREKHGNRTCGSVLIAPAKTLGRGEPPCGPARRRATLTP